MIPGKDNSRHVKTITGKRRKSKFVKDSQNYLHSAKDVSLLKAHTTILGKGYSWHEAKNYKKRIARVISSPPNLRDLVTCY